MRSDSAGEKTVNAAPIGSLAVSIGLPHGEIFLMVLPPNHYMSQYSWQR
jgi:hypothetical protein